MSEAPLRVLVVDDEPLARLRLRRMLGAEPGVHILGECDSGGAAASALAALKPDVVFLDIQMPGLDGFGALHGAAASWQPQVVFVTAFAEHAVDAFDHGAVDYLVKPYSRERLRLALDRARASCRRAQGIQGEAHAARLPVPVGARLRMVPVADIDCLVARLNYVELHVGSERLTLRDTLSGLESQLDPAAFVRIHRSRIVRIAAVREIEALEPGRYVLRLATGGRLGSGFTYRDRVRQVFGLRGG